MKHIKAEQIMDKILVTVTCPDIKKHKVFLEFSPSGTLIKTRTDYAYGIAAPIKDPRLLPQLFFEAILAGAYDEAMSYLAADLKENIDPSTAEAFFMGFFGEFIFVYPDQSGATALIKKTQHGYKTHLYFAETNNNLITNFKEKPD